MHPRRKRRLVYELARSRHHHLICRTCGLSIVMGHEMLNNLSGQIQNQTGFMLDEHHVTLFGYCADCR